MKLRSAFAWIALATLVSGCQTTSIRSAWFDTDFAGPPLRKIVVSARVGGTAESRGVEDAFVEKLRASHQEHRVRPHGPPGPARHADPAFSAAVAGARGARPVAHRLARRRYPGPVSTTMVRGMGWGRGSWGGTAHTTVIPVQQVSQYDLATVETKLFEVQTRQLIWAATTSTLNPRSAAREAPAFASLIIGQLADRKIIASK